MSKRPQSELRDAAQAMTADALKALGEIMRKGSSEHARIAAAQAILERGHGKSGPAAKAGDEASGEQVMIRWATRESEATPDPAARQENRTS